MDTVVFKNEKLWQTYTWCLFRANHKHVEELPGHKKVGLLPGQFITSTRRAAEALDMSVPTLYEYFSILESEHFIERQPNSKYTVITIIDWEESQNPERKSEHKPYNKPNADFTQIIHSNTPNTLNTSKPEDIKEAVSWLADHLKEEFVYKDGVGYRKTKRGWDPIGNLISYKDAISKVYSATGEEHINPIIDDPTFKSLIKAKDYGDDAAVRAKLTLLPKLEKRYPGFKFQKEWTEAKRYL